MNEKMVKQLSVKMINQITIDYKEKLFTFYGSKH